MLVHNIELTVFVKEEDDIDKVKKAMIDFFPFNLEDEKIELKQRTAKGFEHKKITVLGIELAKQKHVRIFLESLLEKLTKEQKELLLRQKETRLDEDLNFFMRFDKVKLLEEGKMHITDSGNCFHLKMKIAAFPAKREKALEAIEKIFKV